ncbi:hypothetical protein QEH56_05870 [Pelagicoccus enzymogenes]|uniref:hypothetical protein n=1 Tax=Pelagicoccus enzymogenes TaxID=2773457 RepID=UPI00280C42B2|nr:hypothetical protein [Pelagicoccus enzymogenes]MDQ8197666.1 hypothetical protein [Pelagicoccus enzymogenes]
MKSVLKLISYLGLALSVVPSLLVFSGSMEFENHYNYMSVGMVLWFASAIFWIKPDQHEM